HQLCGSTSRGVVGLAVFRRSPVPTSGQYGDQDRLRWLAKRPSETRQKRRHTRQYQSDGSEVSLVRFDTYTECAKSVLGKTGIGRNQPGYERHDPAQSTPPPVSTIFEHQRAPSH